LPIKKGVLLEMLPAKLNYADRMKMARDVGFEVIQAPTTPDEHEAEEIQESRGRRERAHRLGDEHGPLEISALVERCCGGRQKPGGMRTSLHNAKLWGSDAVLLVPAVVNPQTSYRDAWSRSQTQIRKLLPLAEELKIVIAIEEVWNQVPAESIGNGEIHRRISKPVDPSVVRRWKCPALRLSAGLDSHAGESISKVHLKDFKRKESGYEWRTSVMATWTGKPCVRPFVKLVTRAAPSLSLKGGTKPTSGT